MQRSELLGRVKSHMGEFAREYGVKRLGLSGSFARDEATEGSDVDMLVEFTGPTKFDDYMDLKFRLEELLGRRVDLVTRKALRARVRPHIEKDLIDVA